jgi:uncharacterized protein (TIGR00288 family)
LEPTQGLQGYKIALLIDFDNVILGVDDPGFDVELVVNALRSRGQVVMGRAYGDWYRHNRHRRKLMEHGIELVETPVFGPVIKNSADIRIVLDGFEIAMLQHHIDAFCLVSGDSDFLPLIKKLQYLGKHVIVVSGNKFTSDLVRRNCNEFISYENLLAESLGATEDVSTLEGSFALLSRSIMTLHERGMEVRSSTVKQMMLQLNPAFSERNFSCPQFKQFLDKGVKAGVVKLGGRDTQSGEFMVFLPGDFDDDISAPEPAVSSKPALNGTNGTGEKRTERTERTGRERRTRRGEKKPETAPTASETTNESTNAPVSPVELGMSAAEIPAAPQTEHKTEDSGRGSEVRPTSSEHLLGRGMRRGRLRFSGKERRAQLASSKPESAEATETTPTLVAEATDLAPELVTITPEAVMEANAAKSDDESPTTQPESAETAPELIAEAIQLAPELVDMATADLSDSSAEVAAPVAAPAAETPAPKKRPTRRGGRGKGKKAEEQATENAAKDAEPKSSAESVTESPAPTEVTEPASAGDAISSPEAAQEVAASESSESAEAKPKTRRRTAQKAPLTPRRRPAAKKKAE